MPYLWYTASIHPIASVKKGDCVYTYPDRSGYPDVSAPDRPSVYTNTIEVYAIRSNTQRYPELFENDFKGGSSGCPRCSLDTCKRGIRISGCVSMSNAHARDAVSFDLKPVFSCFRKLQKLWFALFLSCNSAT